MPALVMKVPPWEGRYDIPDWRLTQRELHEIKLLSGVRAGELIEALFANDRAAVVGLTVVILDRHGIAATADDLWDTKADEIEIDFGSAKAADSDPPTQPAAGDETSGNETTSGVDSVSDGA